MILNLVTKAKDLFYKNGKNVEEALDDVNGKVSRLFKIYFLTPDAEITDCNLLPPQSIGYCYSTSTNMPYGGGDTILTFGITDEHKVQICINTSLGLISSRGCHSGVWTEWNRQWKTKVTAQLDGSGTTTIPYPPGYTKDNCIVVPKFIFNSNEYYMNHVTGGTEFTPQYVQMKNDRVTINSNNPTMYGKSVIVYFIMI